MIAKNEKAILENRYIDFYGNVFYYPENIFEKIYEDDDKYLNNVYCEETTDLKKFNEMMKRSNINFRLKTKKDVEILDDEKISELTDDWLIPEEYKSIDIEEWFLSKKLNKEEKERVNKELDFFKRKNAFNFLRTIIYITDTMKKNNIVWGAGRGSSVASFCLYLIGIHRINPIKYNIPFTEFSKEI